MHFWIKAHSRLGNLEALRAQHRRGRVHMYALCPSRIQAEQEYLTLTTSLFAFLLQRRNTGGRTADAQHQQQRLA